MCLGRQIDVSRAESLQRVSFVTVGRDKTYHLDLPQRIVAVIVQVVCLAVVDAHYTKQQLAVQSQGQRTTGSSLRPDDDLNVLIDLVLQDLSLCELLVLVGGKPDSSKLARLEQKVFGKEHGDGRWRLWLRGARK